MFKQFKNIDSAFKHIKILLFAFLIANTFTTCYIIYIKERQYQISQNRVYVISNGKLMEAISTDKSEQLSVQIRDHVKMFHYYFYSLEPDDEVIKKHIAKALYLADGSAKNEYDNLNEKGYYSNLISANVSQEIEQDSIKINIDSPPYYFKYFGKLKIKRTTSIVTRSLVTEGFIRQLKSISDNNPHGFLIERWSILENKDLLVEKK